MFVFPSSLIFLLKIYTHLHSSAKSYLTSSVTVSEGISLSNIQVTALSPIHPSKSIFCPVLFILYSPHSIWTSQTFNFVLSPMNETRFTIFFLQFRFFFYHCHFPSIRTLVRIYFTNCFIRRSYHSQSSITIKLLYGAKASPSLYFYVSYLNTIETVLPDSAPSSSGLVNHARIFCWSI